MFAIIGLICGIVAALLKLTNQHADAISWLVIIGLIALAIEVVFGVHRAGWYGRRAA